MKQTKEQQLKDAQKLFVGNKKPVDTDAMSYIHFLEKALRAEKRKVKDLEKRLKGDWSR